MRGGGEPPPGGRDRFRPTSRARTLGGSTLLPADFSEVISHGVFLIRKRSPGPGTFSAPGTSLSHFPQHPILTGARRSCRVWILGKFAQEASVKSKGWHANSLSWPLLPPRKLTHLPALAALRTPSLSS